ncbi:MAG: hypothetical protein KG075_21955 [Alphaproteobacteria bacterium]|nr:hypothetical protein [Alphaproteobacteria bacterium]
MTATLRIVAYLLVLLGTNAAAQAADGPFSVAGVDDEQEAYAFLNDLQAAMRAKDRAAIAAMLSKTVKVYRDGKQVSSTDRAVMARFDAVFHQSVAAVILCQPPGGLRANWRGISIGRGTLWFGPELQVSQKVYDRNPDAYKVSDRQYWKLKILTMNIGAHSEQQATECP